MPVTREEIYERDGFRCVYCGFDGSTFEGWRFLTVDHFRPSSRGGSYDKDNLVTACVACNNQKFNSIFPNLEVAKAAMKKERDEVMSYWERNVKPRVLKKSQA